MKIELELLKDKEGFETLAFSFWKRNLKTIHDKKKVVSMIHHLYHMCCIESSMDIEDLEIILDKVKFAKVGFMVDMNLDTQSYSLYTYNANNKK